MNVYEVYDLRDGLFADRKDVEATSPVAALKRLGYTDIVRTDKAGNIVVYGRRGSFVYNARKKN